MKIITVIGARPQIIKAAALNRAIKNHFKNQLTEIILHTGQHYDENMSEVFFRELGIPSPAYNLDVGSSLHGQQTALMMQGMEEVLVKEKPAAVVLYGDTNSTLAGALAASKMNIPVVHIEAGMRSFNKQMPEEINRIVCDHVSTLLFSPTETGVKNLEREGFRLNNPGPYSMENPKVYHCGDVMYDNSLYFSELAEGKKEIFTGKGLKPGAFVLATLHRNTNTDSAERLNSIFSAFNYISNRIPVILPLHPRTKNCLQQQLSQKLYTETVNNKNLHIIPPVSFLEMIALEKNAALVLTDSGGVQKEAFYFKKPCVILRPETEWVELVELGAAIAADAGEKKIISAFERLLKADLTSCPQVYGDGKAAEFIAGEIVKQIAR
ncbi:MAG: non-hydrolyzing UDP-N-acetylglucosamine 2-epimerase [Bacteroidota bacterium]